MTLTAARLAKALCDSSSHVNLLPHSEQRPCEYHLKRAKDTLALLALDPIEVPVAPLPKVDREAERSRLFAEHHRLRHAR